MKRNDYTQALNELSATEGVFTTAQAQALGIPRNVLAKACESGKLIRIVQGAYRMAGTPASQLDDLAAVWKLTRPSKLTHERMPAEAWDGITIAGSTAASILEIGDFYLSPYRILAPMRINSRNNMVEFGVRKVSRDDVIFIDSIPVTKIERTLVDLVLDNEDPSLIQDALADARIKGLNKDRLKHLIANAHVSKTMNIKLEILLGKEY